MKYLYSLAAVIAFFLTAVSGRATGADPDLKMPSLFCDNMVLQQQTAAPVWGWDAPGSKVTVKPSWSKTSYRTTADENGKWMTRVDTPSAGGPYTLEISGSGKVTINNVLIGEVWVCSGQSNMEMPVKGYGFQPTEGAVDAVLDAPAYKDRIHIFNVARNAADVPQDDCSGIWEEATSKSVANTSAVAYFFARRLAVGLDVPVGIIVTCWGGSAIEAWTPEDVLLKALEGRISKETIEKKLARKKEDGPVAVATLYNGMIHPLFPYAAKGFVWYQGCTNLDDFTHYDLMQQAMVECWRKGWEDDENSMPFHFVTIAPYRYDDADRPTRGYFVENQLHSLKLIPNSYAAITETLGDEACIHPAKKQPVADQIALNALSENYGLENIFVGYPVMTGYSVQNDKIRIEFKAWDGLQPYFDRQIKGFEIAGADKVFHPAFATVVPWETAVVVYSPEVPEPVAVRYSFHNYCESNFTNNYGIPVPPFRTDDWMIW